MSSEATPKAVAVVSARHRRRRRSGTTAYGLTSGASPEKRSCPHTSSANTTGSELATKTATTTIYATPEFQGDAEAVAAILGLPDASIEEKPAEALGPGTERADIVVVLGDDAAGAASGGDADSGSTDTTTG